MIHRLSIITLILTCLPLYSQRIYKDSILAKVNGKIITSYDVQELSYREELRLRQVMKGKDITSQLLALRQRALNILIEEQLIIDKFRNTPGFQIPSSLLEERVETSIAKRFGADRSSFYQMLDEKKMTMEEYREEIERGLVVELMKHEFVRKKTVVTPHDIAVYYNDNSDRFVQPTKMHIRMIMIMANKHSDYTQRVEKLHLELKAGGDFQELTKAYHDSPYSGDLGLQLSQDIRSDFLSSLKDHKNGDFVLAINNAKESIFLQLADSITPAKPELSQLHAKIKNSLEKEQEAKYYKEFIIDLRKSAKIEEFIK